MKVAVLGAGAWGTALALTAQQQGHETWLWSWQAEHVAAMNSSHENSFLAGISLPPELVISAQVERTVSQADFVILAVPLGALRATLELARPHMNDGAVLALACKGIEPDTLLVGSAIVEQEWPEAFVRTVVLSGPSFASEVARRVPTNLVAASLNPRIATLVQKWLSTEWLRLYTSSDPMGVEVGGALKNVIAIAAGAVDGLGLGHNTRAALITRGIAEIGRLAVVLGGSLLTVAGLSGVGDLVLTCTGEQSRNRTLGYRLGRGDTLEQALAGSHGVIEGYMTAKSAHELGVRHGIQMPITDAVYSVLFAGQSLQSAVRALLARPLHAEWE